MFHTSTNPCHKDFLVAHNPHIISLLFLCRLCCGFPCVALSNLMCPDLCQWYSQPRIGWLHQVHSVGTVDYTKCRSVFSVTTQFKEAQRQGNTMWNQYTDSTGGEICTWTKDKIIHWHTRDISGTKYIHGHVYKNIHWIIFVTTSNSAFKSRKQIYIHEIKIQKYHYFNQCIQRFAYHTSNHNYHEYKFVYYINANAITANNNNYNKLTSIAQLNAFSCSKNERAMTGHFQKTRLVGKLG